MIKILISISCVVLLTLTATAFENSPAPNGLQQRLGAAASQSDFRSLRFGPDATIWPSLEHGQKVKPQRGQPKTLGAIESVKPPTGESLQAVEISPVPKLGFASNYTQVGSAKGELVQQVWLGGPADRLGLKKGDVIVAVNGKPLGNASSWVQAIDRAARLDGWVTLKIYHAKAGTMTYQTVSLFRLRSK